MPTRAPKHSRRTLVLASLGLAAYGCTDQSDPMGPRVAPAGEATASAAPSATGGPFTCADVRAADPTAADGQYTLVLQGRTANVYCAGMAATPKEYVTLPNTGSNVNYSFFEGDHVDHRYRWYLIPGTDAHTGYSRIRIDPATLVVDRTDQAFTTLHSIGVSGYDWSNPSFKPVPRTMPYAQAGDCYNMWSARGRANVDLTGTDFAIHESVVFAVDGWAQNGSVSMNPARQVVKMTGGGWCGGAGPTGPLKLKLLTPLLPTDDTPPTLTPTITGTLGAGGWYTSDVAVSWSVADAESSIASQSGCTASSVASDTHGQSFTCTATSAGGSATQTVTVKRDATVPAIAFSGNAGSYTVDQAVAISCSATDATSGIASESCPGASGDAYTFAIGANTLNATATDQAGNGASASASFTVAVTSGSLCALTKRFVSQHGVANSMCKQLENGAVGAYVNHVKAQSGKSVSAAHAAILIGLAGKL